MLLIATPVSAVMFIGGDGAVGGGAGCSTSIEDGFSGTLSKWTEHGTSGQWSITSGELKGLNQSVILYTDEQTCGVEQWIMAKWRVSTSGYAGIYFRSSNNESAGAYAVRYEKPATDIVWRSCGGAQNSNTAENCTTIATWDYTLTDDNYVGVHVTGTGNDTVVNVYDLGVSAINFANWAASADSSTSFTTNPGQAADVGTYVGAYNGSSPDLYLDDYTAATP